MMNLLILFLQKEKFAGTSEEALSVQRSMQGVSLNQKVSGWVIKGWFWFGSAEFSIMS